MSTTWGTIFVMVSILRVWLSSRLSLNQGVTKNVTLTKNKNLLEMMPRRHLKCFKPALQLFTNLLNYETQMQSWRWWQLVWSCTKYLWRMRVMEFAMVWIFKTWVILSSFQSRIPGHLRILSKCIIRFDTEELMSSCRMIWLIIFGHFIWTRTCIRLRWIQTWTISLKSFMFGL